MYRKGYGMTPKERIHRVLTGQIPDRFPVVLWLSPEAAKNIETNIKPQTASS